MSASDGALRRSWLFPVLTVALLAVAPLVFSNVVVGLLADALILGLLAASLDLLVGYTGLASLGHSVYYAVGAYAAALLAVEVSAVAPIHIFAALLVGALTALGVGVVAVRLRGIYFLMFTLAVAELVRVLAVSWTDLTGGSNGLSGVPQLEVLPGALTLAGNAYVYWYLLVVVVVAVAFLRMVIRSPFGKALRGIRANEERMAAIGYNVMRYKLTAFVIAGAIAGVAGSLLVARTRFVSPADVGFEVAAIALLIVILGGVGTLYGAFLGALVVLLVRDELGSFLPGHGTLLLGILFVVVVYAMPRGLVGTLLPWAHRSRRRNPTLDARSHSQAAS